MLIPSELAFTDQNQAWAKINLNLVPRVLPLLRESRESTLGTRLNKPKFKLTSYEQIYWLPVGNELSSDSQRFEDFKLLHLKQFTITDFFSSKVHAHQSHDAVTCNLCQLLFFLFLEKNYIFLDLLKRKKVLSHKMVMFPFVECTVHFLDFS